MNVIVTASRREQTTRRKSTRNGLLELNIILYTSIYYSIYTVQVRTEAEDCQHADCEVGVGARAALEQRVYDVVREGECDQCAGHRAHDDTLNPQAQERYELAHRRHDVRVVSARLVD